MNEQVKNQPATFKPDIVFSKETPPLFTGTYLKALLTRIKSRQTFILDDAAARSRALMTAKRMGVRIITRKLDGVGYMIEKL